MIGEKLKIKCPRCKSSDLIIHEIVENAIVYSVKDGIIKSEDFIPDGYPVRVECECKHCLNRWKIRGTLNSKII